MNGNYQFFLVRHGEQVNDRLTEKGREEVALAGKRLGRVCHRAFVFSSPAIRAIETVGILTQGPLPYLATHAQVYFDDRLLSGNYHKRKLHNAFAEEQLRRVRIAQENFPWCAAPCIVLVGHDENRPHLSALIQRIYGKDVGPPPRKLEQGSILAFRDPKVGYEIL